MEGVELNEDIDHYKCKVKVKFGKENVKVASPAGLDAEVAQVNTNPEGLGEFYITKGKRSHRRRTNNLKKFSVTTVSANAEWTCLSPDKEQVAFEGTSTTISWKQPPKSAPDGVESNSPKRKRHRDVVHWILVPEVKNCHHLGQFHLPERLLSTRKAISPTSQEALCQAMESVELNEDIDYYKRKEKVEFGKENEKVASPAGLDTEFTQVNTNSEGLGEVNITKGNASPGQRPNGLNNGRKCSQRKSIRRGRHHSRALPRISTGGASIQSCSENAIVFSQLQMHDFDCLATELMEELKSMKDVVEGRLHSDGCPATFIEYVDKVEKATRSASTVEKTRRRRLYLMAGTATDFIHS